MKKLSTLHYRDIRRYDAISDFINISNILLEGKNIAIK